MSDSYPQVSDDDFWSKVKYFLENNRIPLIIFIIGVLLTGIGLLMAKIESNDKSSIEVIGTTHEDATLTPDLIVEITGAVENPGVYTLKNGSRINDLLIAAGGLSAQADREWTDKNLNKAAKVLDGQKMYIPSVNEQMTSDSAKNIRGIKTYQGDISGIIDINTASQKILEELPGIGPVYAQSIIEHRPYSTVEELLSKDVLKKNVFEKIKDKVSVY